MCSGGRRRRGDLRMGGRKLTMPTRRWWDGEIGAGRRETDRHSKYSNGAGQSMAAGSMWELDRDWDLVSMGSCSAGYFRCPGIRRPDGDHPSPQKANCTRAAAGDNIFFLGGHVAKLRLFSFEVLGQKKRWEGLSGGRSFLAGSWLALYPSRGG